MSLYDEIVTINNEAKYDRDGVSSRIQSILRDIEVSKKYKSEIMFDTNMFTRFTDVPRGLTFHRQKGSLYYNPKNNDVVFIVGIDDGKFYVYTLTARDTKQVEGLRYMKEMDKRNQKNPIISYFIVKSTIGMYFMLFIAVVALPILIMAKASIQIIIGLPAMFLIIASVLFFIRNMYRGY